MTMRSWMQVLPAVGLAIGLSYGGVAQACSMELCSTDVHPREGVVIPANAPQVRLQVFPSRLPSSGAEAELVDHEGTVLSRGAFVSGTALVNTKELVDGQEYRLRFPDSCGSSSGSASFGEVGFRAGPAAPFPSVLGTVAVTESVQASYFGRPPEACFLLGKTAVAEVVLTADALVAPFTPVASLELVLESGEVFPLEYEGRSRWVGTVHAACERYGSDLDGLTEGDHRGEVQGRILGSTSPISPLPVSFSLRCEAPVVDEDPPPASTGCTAADSSPQLMPLVAGVWMLLVRRKSVTRS